MVQGSPSRLIVRLRIPGSPAEARLPEAVGNDHRLAPARHEFFWKESTSDEWLHPERVEESLGHLRAEQHLGIAAARVVVRERNRRGYRRKGLAALAPVEEVRRRNVVSRTEGVAAFRDQTVTMRSASSYGSERNISVSRRVTIDTVPPIPSARMKTAASVNPGAFQSMRVA